MKRSYTILFLSLLLAGCSEEKEVEDKQPEPTVPVEEPVKDTIPVDTIIQVEVEEVKVVPMEKEINPFEQNLIDAGLVNVLELDSTIALDLKYSTEDNFLEKDVYGDFDQCYLQPDVAEKLVLAQLLLRSKRPNYSILVYDAVRPRSVQQKMWNIVDLPIQEKVKFISNPANGSLHNFGAAVDVSLVDEYGNELDMGTPFDYIGELAHPVKEKDFLASGELVEQQVKNRKLLRSVMHKAGFFNIQTEWWHFNSCYRKEAQEKYHIIEGIPLEEKKKA
jgi:D-alanyl-D-alanine dipeptidase